MLPLVDDPRSPYGNWGSLFSQIVQSLILTRKVDVNGNCSSADKGTD